MAGRATCFRANKCFNGLNESVPYPGFYFRKKSCLLLPNSPIQLLPICNFMTCAIFAASDSVGQGPIGNSSRWWAPRKAAVGGKWTRILQWYYCQWSLQLLYCSINVHIKTTTINAHRLTLSQTEVS